MDVDIRALLALPAAERLALAELLISSVGYPADIDAATVPAWRQAEIGRQLARFGGDEPAGACQPGGLRASSLAAPSAVRSASTSFE